MILKPSEKIAQLFNISRKGSFQHFFRKISQGGFFLISAAIIAVFWSNIDPEGYSHFWHIEFTFGVGSMQTSISLLHLINEGLMTLFFLTVGLEIKREFLVGGLSNPKMAALPVAAAVGGMIVPAFLYLMVNGTGPGAAGWGIPVATDIAFSLAVLSTLGSRIPFGIRLFLTAYAIADDLGAIVIIAVFYTGSISLVSLVIALGFVVLLFVLNRLWVLSPLPYMFVGICLWVALLNVGLHASITGVIVALFIPAKGKYNTDLFLEMVRKHLESIRCEDGKCGFSIMLNRDHLNSVQAINRACSKVATPLQQLEQGLANWIAYLVLPLFAISNAGVEIVGSNMMDALTHPIAVGVFLGLVVGKPLGIFIASYATARIFRVSLTHDVRWAQIFGTGCLGGIGFTMSLFISNLSFSDPLFGEYAKVGIVIGSLFSFLIGYTILRIVSEKPATAR